MATSDDASSRAAFRGLVEGVFGRLSEGTQRESGQREFEDELRRLRERVAPPTSRPPSNLVEQLGAHAPRESRYRIEGEIARGGMGAILEAFDCDLRRKLAMKIVLEPLAPAKDQDSATRERVGRFVEEAQVAAQLDHPGIVPVHELGLDAQGRVFFTMRLVRGRELGLLYELAHSGAEGWSTTRVIGLLLKVCEAMAYAHEKGVVHRDLKPANVMVGRFGEVYVMDWGLAKVLGRADSHDLRIASQSDSSTCLESVRSEEREHDPGTPLVTRDGTVLGTPSYMAPEQARGDVDEIDARADVYALGAMLYQLFAGTAPYHDSARLGARHTCQRIIDGPPAPLAELAPKTPPELVAVVERAMARDPAQRYADMLALSEDLRAWLEGRVVRTYRSGPIVELRAWVKRNRSFAATIAAAGLIVVAGSIGFGVVEAKNRSKNSRLSDQGSVDQLAAATKLDLLFGLAKIDEYERFADSLDDLLARLSSEQADDRARTVAMPAGAALTPEAKVASLRALVARIRSRIERAHDLRRRTLESDEAKARWGEARAAIADEKSCPQYRGLQLEPQFGLLPIGPDPKSGLWEFADLATGEEPVRDAATGEFALEPASGIVWVLIPPGELSGDRATRVWHYTNELQGPWPPPNDRRVTIDAFLLSKYEMTQAQWSRLTGSNPSSLQPDRVRPEVKSQYRTPELHPVESISARDSQGWLESIEARFPLDVEWEFAASVRDSSGAQPAEWDEPEESDSRPLHEGRPEPRQGARRGEAARADPDPQEERRRPPHRPVQATQANAFGLHGMARNVWEWCRVFAYDEETELLTQGFVLCGGSTDSGRDSPLPNFRNVVAPDRRQSDYGVRPARTLAR